MFQDFDHDHNGILSHEEFKESYRRWFLIETSEEKEILHRIMKRLDSQETGAIDYIKWSNCMRLADLAEITP